MWDFHRVECKRAVRHIAIQDQSCSKPWATFVQWFTRRLHKYNSSHTINIQSNFLNWDLAIWLLKVQQKKLEHNFFIKLSLNHSQHNWLDSTKIFHNFYHSKINVILNIFVNLKSLIIGIHQKDIEIVPIKLPKDFNTFLDVLSWITPIISSINMRSWLNTNWRNMHIIYFLENHLNNYKGLEVELGGKVEVVNKSKMEMINN